MSSQLARGESLEPEGSTAVLQMRLAGGLQKSYSVDACVGRRMRSAIANGEQGFLAFDAADVVAVINCAKLVWTRVIFDPDLAVDHGVTLSGEAGLDFHLKLYFEGEPEAQPFEVIPDMLDISHDDGDGGDGGADIQWLLAMLEASGDHHAVMSFASIDGEVILHLSRLCLIEAPTVTVRPTFLATALDSLGIQRPRHGS